MKLKALDSFYSTETKQVADRSTFEVDSPEFAKELVAGGLAEIIEGDDEPVADNADADSKAATDSSKSEPAAPKNKAEPAPKNKGE